MTDKLAQLTQQIYEEGVVKAKEEASKIINAANEEKQQILQAAHKEADRLMAATKKEAAEFTKRTESEARMATHQALTLLRQKITELICAKVATASTKEVSSDTQFLKKMIETILKVWSDSDAHVRDLTLQLPATAQKDMKAFLLKRGKRHLDKGLTVTFDEKIKGGFTISPKDGSYRIGFTDKDFNALIQYFLRPYMRDFLFAADKNVQ